MSSRRSSFSFSVSTGSPRRLHPLSGILPQSCLGPGGIQRRASSRRWGGFLGPAGRRPWVEGHVTGEPLPADYPWWQVQHFAGNGDHFVLGGGNPDLPGVRQSGILTPVSAIKGLPHLLHQPATSCRKSGSYLFEQAAAARRSQAASEGEE